MTAHLRGVSLEMIFRRNPRPVFVSGLLFVWDGSGRKRPTVMWLSDDDAEMIRWLKKNMSQHKMVWIYRIRADLVARVRVKDLSEEVIK